MNAVLKNDKKSIIAIAFAAFYVLTLILNMDFLVEFVFRSLRYAINSIILYIAPLITPVLVIIFLLLQDREYKLKNWLFPIAFGVKLILALISMRSTFNTITLLFSLSIKAPIAYFLVLCSLLSFIAVIFIFIGTLFEFKYLNLLKYGALAFAVLSFISLILDFISAGGFKYFESYSAATSINWTAFASLLGSVLFNIGIFILFANKKKQDSAKA